MNESQCFYTIITSTYNCDLDFIITAESIKSQKRLDIQWIVIDGASTQATLDIILGYKSIIHTFISEPDKGIYDAWNKATHYILGEWIIFLGAGDTFHSENTLNILEPIVSESFPDFNIVYGKLNIFSPYNNLFIKTAGGNLSTFSKFPGFRPNVPLHPEVFHHKSLFSKKPVFDDLFKIVGDTEFLNRVYKQHSAKFVDIIITDIRGGGVSQNLKYSLKIFNELMLIIKKEKRKISPYLLAKNYVYFLAKNSLSYIISDRSFWRARLFLKK